MLHVSTARERRGGQRQLELLVSGWRGRAAVAIPPDAAAAGALGDRVRPVGFAGRWWGTAELARVARAERFDLVAAHDAHAVVHAARLGLPLVVHRRVDFAPSGAGARRMRGASGVVAVSEGVARVLRRAGVGRIAVVHDGVPDPPAVDPIAAQRVGVPPGAPLLVAAGALVPHKDHATLIAAIRHLPGAHLVVLGEGSLRAALLAAARVEGVEDRVHLAGWTADVAAWLAAARVVVHPSREEGLGQVVIEAVRLGACTVTTDAGGLPEIPGVAARVPPGRPDLLAAALREHLADPVPGRRLAREAGPVLRERFGADAMVRGTRDAYARFLGDGRSVAR